MISIFGPRGRDLEKNETEFQVLVFPIGHKRKTSSIELQHDPNVAGEKMVWPGCNYKPRCFVGLKAVPLCLCHRLLNSSHFQLMESSRDV